MEDAREERANERVVPDDHRPATRTEVEPTVVGVFQDAVAARRAMERLHRHLDAHKISLFEATGEDRRAPDLDHMGRRVDSRIARRIVGLGVGATVVGALIGLALALAATAVIVALTDAPGATVFVLALITAVFVITGFLPLVVIERNVAESDDWERTFAGERRREMLVGVRAETPNERRLAREALGTAGAVEIRDDAQRNS